MPCQSTNRSTAAAILALAAMSMVAAVPMDSSLVMSSRDVPTSLRTCLDATGAQAVYPGNSNFADLTTSENSAIPVTPAVVVSPSSNAQTAAVIKCVGARNGKVKVVPKVSHILTDVEGIYGSHACRFIRAAVTRTPRTVWEDRMAPSSWTLATSMRSASTQAPRRPQLAQVKPLDPLHRSLERQALLFLTAPVRRSALEVTRSVEGGDTARTCGVGCLIVSQPWNL